MITHYCFKIGAIAVFILCLTLEWTTFVLAKPAIAQESNCIPDQEYCPIGPSCPLACCSGVPARENGGYRRCIAAAPFNSAIVGNDLSSEPTAIVNSTDAVNINANETGDHIHVAVEPIETSTPTPSTPTTAAPVTQVNHNQTAGNKKSIIVSLIILTSAAVIACMLLLGFFIYKRKNSNPKCPGSAYMFSGRSNGLTPDNRTLGNTNLSVSSESMKLSDHMVGSPFSGAMRISSPTQLSSRNMVFSETISRAGSAVHVKHRETHGIVAL